MKTVTGLYDRYDDALHAVKALETQGVPANQISIVSRRYDDETVIEGQGNLAADGAETAGGIGAIVGGAGGLLTGLGLLAIPGVGPVVAAGWLAATGVGALAGAVIGGAAGGIVGAMVQSGIPEEDAQLYAEGIRRGGSIVAARVDDDSIVPTQALLDGSRAVNVASRRATYSSDGWRGFDEGAEPFVPTAADTVVTTTRVEITRF